MVEQSYCVKERKQTGFSGKPTIVQVKPGRFALKGKCASCGITKYKFISKQTASGLLSMLGIKTPLAKIPIIGDILF